MTKEITKAIVMQEIQDMLELREFEPSPFLFSEVVIPTYNIEPHLYDRICRYKEMSITAGPAAYLFYTVADTQRWHLSRYNIIFMATGAYKVTGLYIVRRKELTADTFVYLDMTKGQTASYSVELKNPVVLDPGDRLYAYVDDYTSTADLRVYIDYVRENLR